MESVLIDINDDDEISELLAIVLYDEEHYLRSYLKITDWKLAEVIVSRYAKNISFKEIVLKRESGVAGMVLKKRVALLEAMTIAEMKRLKEELKRVLVELQENELQTNMKNKEK